MSQKLKEIHARLKGIANQQLVHDVDLHECLKDLENEINMSFSAVNDDPPGGNNPSAPDIP